MSSFRTDSNETDGGEGTSLRIPNKGNSLSTERTQYLSNSKRMRGASAATRDANAANSMSSAPKPKPAYRSKSSRYTDTLSAREDSPVRTNLTAAAKPSPLQNSTTGLSQQPVEGPLSPKTHPRSSSNTSNWTASQRLGSNSSQTPQRAPASSARKKRETAPSNASANAFAPSALQLRVETVSRNIASSDDTDKFVLESGMRTPRNTNAPALETVIEGSLPNTPATGASRLLTEKVAAVKARAQENILESNDGDTTDGESTTPTASRSTAGSRAPSIMASTAESESEDYRSEDRYPYFAPLVRTTAVGPSRFTSRRMNSSQQHNTESLRNMTVETETVTSMIQLGGGPGGTGSSLRSKKSSDTIRAPKKEKKRRQTAAISTTNATSTKAEIFSAQVAAAVHEADSSDSDETFVYESNPSDQRPTRFHSRTPSVTSIHGGPDPRMRNVSLHEQQGPPMGKTRMKFVQPNHSSGASAFGDGDGGGGGGGAGGGGSYGTIGGSSSRNDYGNVARNGGGHSRHMHSTNNRPLYADEFIPGPKQSLRSTAMAHITSSKKNQSPTPRSAHGRSAYGGTNGHNNGGGSKRNTRALPSPRYGADDEGDDERVPLMSTRHERNRPRHNNSLNGNNRRPQSASLRQLEHNQRRRSCIGRFASCFIAVITICLVIAGTIGFMFATSKPLQDVKVLNMTDVLVSQQEIMLDLLVQAVNPNVIGVTVQAMDVNVFAKSSWVRDDKDKDKDPPEDGDEDEKVSGGDVEDTLALSEHFPLLHEVAVENDIARRSAPSLTTKHLAVRGWRELLNPIPKKGVDEGTDPDPNLPDQEDRQTMLLGRIFQFDSALSFDGSPLQRRPSTSQGGIRLAKPGNKTEIGGTERWERVILHPFELIVRGVLKYQLPLNGRVRTASIGASVMVNPAADELVEGLREVVWAG